MTLLYSYSLHMWHIYWCISNLKMYDSLVQSAAYSSDNYYIIGVYVCLLGRFKYYDKLGPIIRCEA